MKSRIEIRKISDGVFKHINQDGEILIDSRIQYVATQNIFYILGQKNSYSYSYNEIEVYDDTSLGVKEVFSNSNFLTIRLRELGYTGFQDDALTDAQLRATAIPISPRPNTTGVNGTIPYKLTSLASTNANSVKNTGGNLYSIVAIGLTSTVRFLKLYNKASAPTVGTDVPVMTIPVPANTQGAGISIPFSMGVNFPLGIALAITANAADNDATVVAAGDVIINLTYA